MRLLRGALYGLCITPDQAWRHFLAIGADRKLFVADLLNWRFQVFLPVKTSGKLSDYVPAERQFYGFKQSDGYYFRSPGWPTK